VVNAIINLYLGYQLSLNIKPTLIPSENLSLNPSDLNVAQIVEQAKYVALLVKL